MITAQLVLSIALLTELIPSHIACRNFFAFERVLREVVVEMARLRLVWLLMPDTFLSFSTFSGVGSGVMKLGPEIPLIDGIEFLH